MSRKKREKLAHQHQAQKKRRRRPGAALTLWRRRLRSWLQRAVKTEHWGGFWSERIRPRLPKIAILSFLSLLLPAAVALFGPFQQYIWYQCIRFPLSGSKAEIIVSDFAGGSQGLPWSIKREIEDRISTASLGVPARVHRTEGLVIDSHEEALRVAERCGATIVIWGKADEYGAEVYYSILDLENLRLARPKLSSRLENIEQYRLYINEGIPKEFEYLALITVGQLAYSVGDHTTAISALEQALAVARAIDIFIREKQIDLNGELPDLELETVFFYLGNSYDEIDEPNKAIAAYTAGLQFDPEHARLYLNRGYVYYYQDDLAAARADVRKALEIDSSYPAGHSNLASILYREGEFEKAIQEYDKALALDSSLVEAYFNRALTRYQLGDVKGFEEDLKEVLDISDNETYRFFATKLLEDPEGPWLIPWELDLP